MESFFASATERYSLLEGIPHWVNGPAEMSIWNEHLRSTFQHLKHWRRTPQWMRSRNFSEQPWELVKMKIVQLASRALHSKRTSGTLYCFVFKIRMISTANRGCFIARAKTLWARRSRTRCPISSE